MSARGDPFHEDFFFHSAKGPGSFPRGCVLCLERVPLSCTCLFPAHPRPQPVGALSCCRASSLKDIVTGTRKPDCLTCFPRSSLFLVLTLGVSLTLCPSLPPPAPLSAFIELGPQSQAPREVLMRTLRDEDSSIPRERGWCVANTLSFSECSSPEIVRTMCLFFVSPRHCILCDSDSSVAVTTQCPKPRRLPDL